MDDMYFIVPTKEEALSIIEGIKAVAKEIGLFVNEKKTRIVRLSGNYKYLQIKYRLTDTGKVVKRINPKQLTRERRRIKKYFKKVQNGEIPYEDIEQAYKSWMGAYTPIMSRKQIRNMKILYKILFGKEPRWKK